MCNIYLESGVQTRTGESHGNADINKNPPLTREKLMLACPLNSRALRLPHVALRVLGHGDEVLAVAAAAGVAAVQRAVVRTRLPRGQLVHAADAHHPRDQTARHPAADEAVDVGAEADAHGAAGDGAVDHVEDGVVQVAQVAALEPADAAGRDGGGALDHEVTAVGVARVVGPHEGLGGFDVDARGAAVHEGPLGGVGALGGLEAGEVEGAELDVGDGDAEGSQLGGQDLGEGGEGGGDGGLGGVEGRVDGGDDGRGEDQDLGRGPLLARGAQAAREEG